MNRNIRSFLVILVTLCVTTCCSAANVQVTDPNDPYQTTGKIISQSNLPVLDNLAANEVWHTHASATLDTIKDDLNADCSSGIKAAADMAYGTANLPFSQATATACMNKAGGKLTIVEAFDKYLFFYAGHENPFATKGTITLLREWLCGGSDSSHKMWEQVNKWNEEVNKQEEAKKKRDAAAKNVKDLIDNILSLDDAKAKRGYAYQTKLVEDFRALIKQIGIPMGGSAARLVFPVAVMFASFMMAVF